MRRKGVGSGARADVKRAYNLLYRSGLNIEQAIGQGKEIAWSEQAERFMKFVSHRTKRGLCSARGGSLDGAEG